MPDDSAAVTEQLDLSGLLRDFEIARVVYVDDCFSEGVQKEALVVGCTGALVDAAEALRTELIGEIVLVETSDDTEHLRAAVLERLKDRSAKELLTLAIRLKISDDSVSPRDWDTAELLRTLVAAAEWIPLSLGGWKARGDDLLKQHREGKKTLFLFDLNLSAESGAEDEGVKLIQQAFAKAESATFGLLSKIGQEREDTEWQSLSAKINLDKNSYLFAAKDRIHAGASAFAKKLRPMLAAPDFRRMRHLVFAKLGQALDEARKRVEKVDVLDFEHVVFRTSAEEGVWETDTLVRLLGVYQRREFKRLAQGDEDLQNAVAKLSMLMPKSVEPDAEEAIKSSAYQLQRDELYWQGESINPFLEPLEFGDVFETEVGTETKRYMLLQQPCDLAVRRDGTRDGRVAELVLVQIKSRSATEVSEKGKPDREQEAELVCFEAEQTARHYLDLKAVHHVQDWVLDACVFNSDGRSVVECDKAPPPGLISSWRARHPEVIKRAKRFIAVAKFLKDKQLKSDLVPCVAFVCNTIRLKMEWTDDGKKIEFKVRRIGRMIRERAAGQLLRLALFRARPAFDHPFLK